MKKIVSALTSTVLLSAIVMGCSTAKPLENSSTQPTVITVQTATPKSDDNSTPAAGNMISFKDSTKQEVTLKEKPKRVVLLNTEIQELFYQVGGKAVGLATAPGIPVPEAAKDAEKVGEINQVSLEKVMSLKPDLVIGQTMFHASLKDSLASSQIPLALIDIKSYEDIKSAAELFGKIVGKEVEAKAAIDQTEQKMQTVISKLPQQSPKFAMITIMPMGISVQKNSTLSLDVANRLKLKNVAESLPAGMMPSAAPFSLEKLVELDPDYLFFIVHGTEEYGKEKLKTDLESNPAWKTLRAVKENKIYFLPSNLFVTNPGLNFNQSLTYLAKLVYPEIYGNMTK
ncbi:ABC transporter substrate-binding protein [Paenibacillus alginolyticus]|uniref:ABC transporter substrate-binding protein n=1 Tax=Paenibacillus alginolyticus TaxID=59839 RepID=UPI0004924E1B|nr:ABC transporter substrate-binding protein [Paenibacillus alginolyticus]MCY9670615.1 ABC transporter substrate-binding protein [Paenibacillus alginolyticus]